MLGVGGGAGAILNKFLQSVCTEGRRVTLGIVGKKK